MAEARRQIRATPVGIDVAVELCRTAKILAEQQEDIPLLRDAVERQLRATDKSNAAVDELVRELRELRAAVDRNTTAILEGKTGLAEHAAELRASRGGGKP